MDELQESVLGTQEYWDSRYKEEIANFENHGDPGEVWFGEDTVDRVIKWVTKNLTSNSKILDIGCGNGMFLVELASQGYTELTGIDYSEDGIELAKSIAKKRKLKIAYFVSNILEGFEGQFDIIHDKGTYDAISLNANIKKDRAKYLDSVYKGLHEGGFFVITSCNWTRNELDGHFKDYFTGVGVIPAPQFQFGGKTGSTVTSMIYRKIKKE